MLSLSTAKSGALIGVLISVTTIGVAAAYRDGDSLTGSIAQLALNLASILVAGTTVLTIQRVLYRRRRRHHIANELPANDRRDRALSASRAMTRRRPWS